MNNTCFFKNTCVHVIRVISGSWGSSLAIVWRWCRRGPCCLFRGVRSTPLVPTPGCNHCIHQSLWTPQALCWSLVRSEIAEENLCLCIVVSAWRCSKTLIFHTFLIYIRCSRPDESLLQRNNPQWNTWAEQQWRTRITNTPTRLMVFTT